MTPTIDEAVRKKFMGGFPRTDTKGNKVAPSWFVVHGTAGGGTYQWMLNQTGEANYKKGIGLFHYLIDRAGECREIIDPDNWVYHSHSNYFDVNTIGCELVNTNTNNGGIYTDEQYHALVGLIDYLMTVYEITTISAHDYLYYKYVKKHPKVPPCPGPAFDWDRFGELLGNYDFDLDIENQIITNFKGA